MLRQYSFVGILTLLLTGLQVWSGHITRLDDMPRPEVDSAVRNQMLGLMGPVKSGSVLGEQNTLLDMRTLNGISSFFQNDGLGNPMVSTRSPASSANVTPNSAGSALSPSSVLDQGANTGDAKVWQRVSRAPLVIEPIREGAHDGNRSNR
jgi:hypothetical protein